ncbi:Protein FLX-like 1 [Striga hermonthica]|uniref:Protein FLX-like 1 n=1 Tax=Striga hermonthica TaxID=68872 RepID=A0A9N7RG31_STRHE|nr:Protein FLX-like 1 [Striga hermonthica]
MEPLYPIRRLTPTDIHLIEARIAANDREIQTLLRDNQRLAAAHVALKQDATAAQDDLRRASAAAASVKADRDARVREVYDRSLKLEVEARPFDGIAADLGRVRAAIEELRAERKDRLENLMAIEGEIAAAQSELRRVPQLRSEIEAAQREIHQGREAIQREREMQTTNFQIDRAMEKHLVAMAREAEKLRSELADAEKRAVAMAAASGLNPGPGFDLIRY